jgi:hypothetical protein
MSDSVVTLVVGTLTVGVSYFVARHTARQTIRAEGVAARQRAYDGLLVALEAAAEPFINNPYKFASSDEWSALRSSWSMVAVRGSHEVAALTGSLIVHMQLVLNRTPTPRSSSPESTTLVRDAVMEIRRAIRAETA